MVGDDTWLSVSQAAKMTGLSVWKIRQLADEGTLKATTVPGSRHRRILASSAQELVDRMRREAHRE